MRMQEIRLIVCGTIFFGSVLQCRSTENPAPDATTHTANIIHDAGQIPGELAGGLERWQSSTQTTRRTYFYWRVRPGSESGVREVTGIQIQNGIATNRWLTRARINASGAEPEIFERFSEAAGKAGATPAGFPARTMEELYARCAQVLPKGANDPATQSLEFGLRIDSRGILSECWVAEKGCQGDCASNFGVAGLVFRAIDPGEIQSFLNTSNPDIR